MFFRPPFFGGRPQFLDLVFKIAPISDHVAKFRGDRPRDRIDLALNKKRKKQAKHKGRGCVIATGGPNKQTATELSLLLLHTDRQTEHDPMIFFIITSRQNIRTELI